MLFLFFPKSAIPSSFFPPPEGLPPLPRDKVGLSLFTLPLPPLYNSFFCWFEREINLFFLPLGRRSPVQVFWFLIFLYFQDLMVGRLPTTLAFVFPSTVFVSLTDYVTRSLSASLMRNCISHLRGGGLVLGEENTFPSPPCYDSFFADISKRTFFSKAGVLHLPFPSP